MLLLSLELLQSGELPELAVGGAWATLHYIMSRGSVPLGPVALEGDICGLATAHLRAIGRASDWMVRSSSLLHALKRVCALPVIPSANVQYASACDVDE